MKDDQIVWSQHLNNFGYPALIIATPSKKAISFLKPGHSIYVYSNWTQIEYKLISASSTMAAVETCPPQLQNFLYFSCALPSRFLRF